ncbi:amidase signature domain-containing protein [Parachaetomium inaequale]|uniref:Amidase signature domain-containing protein n=1 Tax=Parachaetomium inaequale TaxID=2588326 RepID=A0AAN6SMD8_9PEZI|nr:amidase signature domain-containing protein [Parachaetomium inaequale]
MSTVIELQSTAFYVEQHDPDTTLQLTDSAHLQPLAVFHTHGLSSCGQIQDLISQSCRDDDVLASCFLTTIVFVTADNALSSEFIQKGPFFFSSEGIFWTARLTVPSSSTQGGEPTKYHTLNASAYGAATLCIAVPSRLYATSTKPLAGMRVAVKDVFHLNGVRTTCGNRAYGQLYGPSKVSSASVQKAVDLGATVLGKTKTAEFAGSQEVIGDWADYSYAFNSRAHGYSLCTGSSTGSASAVTAYSWVDIGLGSDAGGSVRDPAVAHGIYGFRPSHDGSLERDTPALCKRFQRSAYLGRDIRTMVNFGQHWLGEPLTRRQFYRPKRVLIIEEFSTWLDVEALHISLESVWQATSIRGDYKEQFAAAPYVCKVTKWLWDFGSSITPEQRQQALARVQVHNAWFNKHVLGGDETVALIPRHDLDYRDEYLPIDRAFSPTEQRDFFGFGSNLHATFAGLPHLIMPIAQCPFNSHVSAREEVFPVSMGIVGAQGTDLDMLRMVEDFLTSTGLPTGVLTGRTAFPI